MTQLINRPASLYATVFAASMAMSLWIYLQPGLINKDGILYIEVAKRFIEGGFAEAFAAFNWPMYGILIGLTRHITQLGLEESAHLLNSLLMATICVAFVAIYREIDHKGTRPWFAGLLVLCLPILNNYRDFVIRDFGYWAFSLLALLFLVRNVTSPSLARSILWQSAALLAITFRIEGIVFLGAPAIYLGIPANSLGEKLRSAFQASFLIVTFGLAGIFLIVAYGGLLEDSGARTLALWLSYISPNTILAGFREEAQQLHEQLQHLSSIGDASLVLAGGLLSLAAFEIINNAVIPLVVVAIYGHNKGWLRPSPVSNVVKLYFFLACLPTLAILASKFFLSSRYTVLGVLLLSLLTIPYLDIAFQRIQASKKRRWLIIAWLGVAALFLDSVISTGPSKAAIKVGARWALENLEQSETWLCNEVRLRFYSENACMYLSTDVLLKTLSENDRKNQPGYLLLWVSRKDKAMQATIDNHRGLTLVKNLPNRRGDRLLIYAVDEPRPTDHEMIEATSN